MKKYISGVVSIFLFAIVASPSGVVAVQDTTTQTDAAPTAQTAAVTGLSRAERIAEYKARTTETLSALRARQITTLCKNAQTKVVAVKSKYDNALQKRKDTYDSISTKLRTLVSKLQKASLTTASVEASMVELDSLMTAALASLDQYGIALSDVSEMDCVSDPQGFQSALSVAREQREDAITKLDAVKSYVRTDIKTQLQTLRERITATESTAN